ncbi:ABC transporter ATP-binding protein [Hominilimicola sp.]|uniref:ABC transporter ATP-binding protein n=1 Tax=Hominilimicola sp. TaxID=3073571 RepID=UPI0039916202
MKNNKTLSKLNSYIAGNRKYLILVIISALLANIFMLVAPYISGRAIDFIKGENNVDFPMVAKFIGILFAVYVLNALFTWGMTVFTNALSNHSIEKMRKDAFGKISKLPLKFFDGHSHGDIISRLTNDIDAVSEGLLQGITQLFSGIVTVVGSLVLMFLLDWRITLCVIVITIICIFVSKAIATNSGKMFRLQAQTIGELNGYVSETVGNLKVVKAFGYEDKSSEVFGEINSRLYDCGQKAQFYSSLVNPTTRYINNLAYISVGVLGGFAALAGHLSVGIISSFLIYATQFARPINDMTSILTQLQSAQAAAARIFALGEIEPETPDEDRPELEVKNGEVMFKDVDFSYNKDKELIKDLNIVAKQGQGVAIVGPTGAGKTTIVNLLMNFYGVDKGTIFVDGQAIDSVQRDSLRKNFGMVLQDTWLFAGTVKENIAYGKEGATDEEIINAAKAASAHGFIKRLPNGYDTMITEDGGNLSSGQKQLLTIARAMLSDPKILILDEATSNVDTMTEQRIQKAFLKMMEGRTSFIIAHRLSTIREADLILVMDKGRIIEQGTHNELLAKNGFYTKLYNS